MEIAAHGNYSQIAGRPHREIDTFSLLSIRRSVINSGKVSFGKVTSTTGADDLENMAVVIR